MASFTVQLTSSPACDTVFSYSDVQEQLTCQLRYPGYFGYTFGAISAASFFLNLLLESISTCSCALQKLGNEVRFLSSFCALLSGRLLHPTCAHHCFTSTFSTNPPPTSQTTDGNRKARKNGTFLPRVYNNGMHRTFGLGRQPHPK